MSLVLAYYPATVFGNERTRLVQNLSLPPRQWGLAIDDSNRTDMSPVLPKDGSPVPTLKGYD